MKRGQKKKEKKKMFLEEKERIIRKRKKEYSTGNGDLRYLRGATFHCFFV